MALADYAWFADACRTHTNTDIDTNDRQGESDGQSDERELAAMRDTASGKRAAKFPAYARQKRLWAKVFERDLFRLYPKIASEPERVEIFDVSTPVCLCLHVSACLCA